MLGLSLGDQEIAAIGRGKKILRPSLDDPQAMLIEPQISDHLRIQEAHRVGGHRVSEARMKLLGYRGAANHGAPLEDLDLQSGHAEVGRAGQSVVTGADDDGVIALHRWHLSGLSSLADGHVRNRLSNDVIRAIECSARFLLQFGNKCRGRPFATATGWRRERNTGWAGAPG